MNTNAFALQSDGFSGHFLDIFAYQIGLVDFILALDVRLEIRAQHKAKKTPHKKYFKRKTVR